LWDVTDGDLDSLTLDLISRWIKTTKQANEEEDETISTLFPTSLPQALAASRSVCKLKYLNAAAAVCYGVPIRSKKISSLQLPSAPTADQTLEQILIPQTPAKGIKKTSSRTTTKMDSNISASVAVPPRSVLKAPEKKHISVDDVDDMVDEEERNPKAPSFTVLKKVQDQMEDGSGNEDDEEPNDESFFMKKVSEKPKKDAFAIPETPSRQSKRTTTNTKTVTETASKLKSLSLEEKDDFYETDSTSQISTTTTATMMTPAPRKTRTYGTRTAVKFVILLLLMFV